MSEPGAVFGELSMLLDQPHTADVRALEVAEITSPMQQACCLTMIRLLCSTSQRSWRDVSTATNRSLIEVKWQLSRSAT